MRMSTPPVYSPSLVVDNGITMGTGVLDLNSMITASAIDGALQAGSLAGSGLGMFGATVAGQQGPIPDPTSDTAANNAAIISILNALRTYGLLAV